MTLRHELSSLIQFTFELRKSFNDHLILQGDNVQLFKPPRGILVSGPSGVGKTFSIRKAAQDCEASLIFVNIADVFQEDLGVTEAALRVAFQNASQMNNRCVLFIDEIDVLAPKRDAKSNSFSARAVAQLLTLMDGVYSKRDFVVIGATNRPEEIDPALRRPGRFDREIIVQAPSETDRAILLRELLLPTVLSDDSINYLSIVTSVYVHSDIVSFVREARLLSSNRSSNELNYEDLILAVKSQSASLTKSSATVKCDVSKFSWERLGGLDDVRRLLEQSILWPLKYRMTFARLKLPPIRGVLLYGPPGCAKTTLVQIMASTSSANMYSLDTAAIYSAYVGDSERCVRELFKRARCTSPSIIFMDELDSLVGSRDAISTGSRDVVRERILSTLLNEMDGILGSDDVLVVGATNRLNSIDSALLRPGRFDRIIHIPLPSKSSRMDILRVCKKSTPFDESVNLAWLANQTEGFSGADIVNLVQEAALMSLRNDRSAEKVSQESFSEALTFVRSVS